MQSPQNPYNPSGASSGQQPYQPATQNNYDAGPPPSYGAPISNPVGGLGVGSNIQPGLRTIRRIDVLSAMKFGAVMSAAMFAILGIPFMLVMSSVMSSMASMGGGNAGAGMAGGFVGYIMGIVIYGILGGIGGAIYSLIYNVVANVAGGLQIEIQ